jgi:glutamyl-tRNA synthetase
VIRGNDHLSNTPKQVLCYEALGYPLPVFAHMPMILAADKTRLSKRHGATSVLAFRDMGILPEAMLNYLARLGWSHGDQEIFTLEEMIRLFDIVDVNKSASALNPEKLLWTNQQHILRARGERLAEYLAPQLASLGVEVSDRDRLIAVARAQQERARTMKEMAEASLFFFREPGGYDHKAAAKHLTRETAPLLAAVRARLAELADWRAPALHAVVSAVAAEQSAALGKVAQPLRVAVSGGAVSPPIDDTLEILGRETTIARLDRAIARASA